MRLLLVPAFALASLVFPPPPAHAAASSHLVYAGDPDHDGRYSLFRRTDGGGQVPVVDDGRDSRDPAVSPDGRHVAYVSQVGAHRHLFVRAVDGTGAATQVTSGPYDDGVPAWSPDGHTLAFARYNPATGEHDIYVVPSRGGTAARVPGGAGATEPSFSPSGRQIAVASEKAPFDIHVVTRATGARVAVPGTANGSDPDWSRDGGRIVFVSHGASGRTRLLVATPRGAVTTLLPEHGTLSYFDPTWSPDGTAVYHGGIPAGDDAGPSSVYRTTTANRVTTAVAHGGGVSYLEPSFWSVGGARDTTAPPAVTGLGGMLSSGRIDLRWTTTTPDVAEFVVRRSAPGGPAPATPTTGVPVYDGGATAVAATGLANGSAYTFSVFAVDASGNVSRAASLTARILPAPAVSAPAVVSSVTAGTTFPVRWSTPGGFVPASYDVEYGLRARMPDGTWSPVTWKPLLSATTATSSSFTGHQGQTYSFRVRSRDANGHRTGWSLAAAATVPLNETYGLAYSAGWTRLSTATRWLGTMHYAVAADRTVTLVAETAGFRIVADRCSACGQVRVYVDGVLRATVDTASPTAATQVRQLVWGTTFPDGIRRHELKLVTVGTAGRPRFYLDGVALAR